MENEELILSLSTLVFIGYSFFKYQYYITYKDYNMNEDSEFKINYVPVPIAITAMEEYPLVRIAANTDNSKKKRDQALSLIKRIDFKLHDKVKRRWF